MGITACESFTPRIKYFNRLWQVVCWFWILRFTLHLHLMQYCDTLNTLLMILSHSIDPIPNNVLVSQILLYFRSYIKFKMLMNNCFAVKCNRSRQLEPGVSEKFVSGSNLKELYNSALVNCSFKPKVPTKSLQYFENYIFQELFGNEVFILYCIYHCKACSFCFTMLPHL